MKMRSVLFAGVFLFFLNAKAQTIKDSLILYNLQIVYNGKNLSFKEAMELTKSIPEAFSNVRKAKVNYPVGYLLGTVGSTLVGYSVGRAISTREISWPILITGGALLSSVFPLIENYKRYASTAVSIYNSERNKKY